MRRWIGCSSRRDSPYLTPVPFRGHRNEPMYVKHVAEALARIRNIPFEQAAQATYENGKRAFSAPVKGIVIWQTYTPTILAITCIST